MSTQQVFVTQSSFVKKTKQNNKPALNPKGNEAAMPKHSRHPTPFD